MSLSYDAMVFARETHKDQKRKYLGTPYFDHLAEVAGIAMSAGWHNFTVHPDKVMAVCFLHDSIEDQEVGYGQLLARFGEDVANGVMWLSDLEEGNRATRKRLSRERLAGAPAWIQTIKCADLISNTSSIREFGGSFAPVYLEEKRLLLEVLTKSDRRLHSIAMELANREIV